MKALEQIEGVTEIAVFGSGLHVTVRDPEMATTLIREEFSKTDSHRPVGSHRTLHGRRLCGDD
ncbi:MAG: hypothetical protein U0V70_03630 [Terriglobia bacterium]